MCYLYNNETHKIGRHDADTHALAAAKIKFKPLIKNFFLTVLLSMCVSYAGASQAEQLAVQWTPITLQDSYQYQQQYAGRIRSKDIANLGFELAQGASATLQQINVDVGDDFKKGQVLAILDTRLQKKKILRLQAQLNEAKANLALAKATVKRFERLSKQDYASKQRHDEAIAQEKSQEYRIQAISHQLDQANIELTKQSIIAPFNGYVTKRFKSEGDLVQSGQSILQVLDKDEYQVNIGVPVRYLGYLKIGMPVEITIDKQRIAGKIKSISSERETATQTHNVLIETLPTQKFIPNRALATIDLKITIKQKGAWVPLESLIQNYRGLWSVYRLKKVSNQQYQIKPTDVKILFSNDKQAYIQTDLTQDTKIVASGLLRIVPGEQVTLAKEDNGNE